MIFITGPLYSGKRTFAQRLPGTRIAEVQALAAEAEDLEKLEFYDDSLLPLYKLYGLETVLDRALGKRVWLKSGGYLVIEPTEAMTVIDVNTGKYEGRKKMADTIRKINNEAAFTIAAQLRLRNLSGIIMVVFLLIMEQEEEQKGPFRLT